MFFVLSNGATALQPMLMLAVMSGFGHTGPVGTTFQAFPTRANTGGSQLFAVDDAAGALPQGGYHHPCFWEFFPTFPPEPELEPATSRTAV